MRRAFAIRDSSDVQSCWEGSRRCHDGEVAPGHVAGKTFPYTRTHWYTKLQLRTRFPLLSIFLDFQLLDFFLNSLLVLSSVSSGLRKSFTSSPHLFFFWSSHCSICLVLGAGAWVPLCCFFVHHSSGNDAILVAKRHFILPCVSIQHGIFAIFHLFNCGCFASFHVFNPNLLLQFHLCQPLLRCHS